MNRRSFMKSILAASLAPAVFRSGISSGILMPVRQLWVPNPIAVWYIAAAATAAQGKPYGPVRFTLSRNGGESLLQITINGPDGVCWWHAHPKDRIIFRDVDDFHMKQEGEGVYQAYCRELNTGKEYVQTAKGREYVWPWRNYERP